MAAINFLFKKSTTIIPGAANVHQCDGCKEIGVDLFTTRKQERWYMGCTRCDNRGAVSETVAGALRNWNKENPNGQLYPKKVFI